MYRTLFLAFLILIPKSLFAGYVFDMTVDSDGNKNRIVHFIEGDDKRTDIYVDGELHSSVLSVSKSGGPVYVMHQSGTYMTKLPSVDDMWASVPDFKFEQPKQPMNPAEEALKAMDNMDKTKNRIDDIKGDPKGALYDAMTDISSQIQSRQQAQMVEEQMKKIAELQKTVNEQLEQHKSAFKKSMAQEIALKNAVSQDDFDIKPCTQTKKIGQFTTRLVQVFYKGKLYQDVWVSGALASEISDALNSLATDSKFAGPELEKFYLVVNKINGMIFKYGAPVLTVSYHKGENRVLYLQTFPGNVPEKVVLELTKFEKRKIAPAEFAPPRGYIESNAFSM